MVRTADRLARTPSHSPSAPLPIGVMAPMPGDRPRAGAHGRRLRQLPDAPQRAPGDGLDELRADDVLRREAADERPAELEPVLDAHVEAVPVGRLVEAPGHPHPARDAAGVDELDTALVTHRSLDRLPAHRDRPAPGAHREAPLAVRARADGRT